MCVPTHAFPGYLRQRSLRKSRKAKDAVRTNLVKPRSARFLLHRDVREELVCELSHGGDRRRLTFCLGPRLGGMDKSKS